MMWLRALSVGCLAVIGLASAPRAEVSPDAAARIGRPLVREVIGLIARRDFEALALRISAGGLFLSPYLSLAEGRVQLTTEELRRCATDPRILHWGNRDGSGEPIRLTCAHYFGRFVPAADFRRIGPTTFNRPLTAGTERDDHLARFPDAVIGWRFRPEGRDAAGRHRPWQSLHLIFVRESGAWRLAAIARGTWTI